MTLLKDGELDLRQQRRLCCIQCKEVCILPLIHFCLKGIGEMIRCSDTRCSQLTFSLTHCWLGSNHIAGTLAHKFMCTRTHGVKHILQRQKEKHAIHFLCSFHMREYKNPDHGWSERTSDG